LKWLQVVEAIADTAKIPLLEVFKMDLQWFLNIWSFNVYKSNKLKKNNGI
jgi:hypothetical protein